MREIASKVAFIGLALLPVACGGAPQTATPQNPSPVAVGSDPVLAEAPVNLTPVEEPKDVVVVARWKNPRRVFDTLQQWVGIPIPVEMGVEEVLRVPGFTSVIDMDAPVDALVALDDTSGARNPKPFVSFSVGLRSTQDARQALQGAREVRELQEGVFRVELGSEWDKLICLVSPSLGSSPGRMVCGPRDRDVEVLHPYMTRGLPVVALPDRDLSGEVRLAPIQSKYGKMLPQAIEMGSSFVGHELGTGDRNLDRAISDAVGEVGKELVSLSNDLDSLRFEVQLEPDTKTLSGELSLAFKTRNSWLAQRFFDNANKAGAPPPLFWSAPADSTSAFFDRGVDAKNYEMIRRHGGNLLDAAMARENLPPADRKAVVALFEKLMDGTPISVSAAGRVESTASKGASEFDKIRDAAAVSLGWQVIGLDERSTRVDAWLQDLARVYGRAAIQRWLRSVTSVEAKNMPQVRYGAMTVTGLPGLKALQVSVPATILDPSIKGAKPFTYYVMVLPEGARTWVAMGADQAALEKQLKAIKAGGASTLESKPGLEALRSGRVVGGGFITMAGIANQASGGLMEALDGGGFRNREMERMLTAFSRLPNGGNTPMLLTTQTQDGSPARVAIQFKVNRGTVDDLRSLVLSMGGHSAPIPMIPRKTP